MVRVELTIEIDCPPEDVFAYLADVSNLPVWQSGVRQAELVGGGEPRAGARIAESRQLLGRDLQTTIEIAECEPPVLLALRALDGPVPFSVRHDLEPVSGGTRLTVAGEGDAGLLPGFAAGIVARRAEKQFRRDFERLKRLVEARCG